LINGLNLHAKLVYSGGVCGRWLMDHNSETSVWFHLVNTLCAQAGVSKSVLSEKFAALIGHSPIEYLTLWRLQIAAH